MGRARRIRDRVQRLRRAEGSDQVVNVVTSDELRNNRVTQYRGRLTWRYRARNVRDFAFSASRVNASTTRP